MSVLAFLCLCVTGIVCLLPLLLKIVQCIVIGSVCLSVGIVVCYHDNSKLRASILTKLTSHVSRTPLSNSKGQLTRAGAYCGGLPHSILFISGYWQRVSQIFVSGWTVAIFKLYNTDWTTGAISRAKLQSNHHHQQTNIQFFYRPYARASIVYDNILRFSQDSLRSTLAGHFQYRENEKKCAIHLLIIYK